MSWLINKRESLPAEKMRELSDAVVLVMILLRELAK